MKTLIFKTHGFHGYQPSKLDEMASLTSPAVFRTPIF